MRAVVVVPVIDGERAHRLHASMAPAMRECTLWVVNGRRCPVNGSRIGIHRPGRNLGVAASWNMGRQAAIDWEASWLIHMSEAMVMGESGGIDVLDALRTHADQPWLGFIDHGWKLYASSVAMLEDVGRFDENFWPAYMEETDYLYRMGLAGWPSPRENDLPGGLWVENEATNPDGDAHCITEGLVPEMSFGALSKYYASKWGGDPGAETFTHPFDDQSHDHRWWPTPGARSVSA